MAIVAMAAAQAPAEGDVGTIQHCVATGAEGDECSSCYEEREEEEEEEGEEKEDAGQSKIQQCIDKCSKSYTLTQLADATMLNIECEMNGGEECEETKYQRISLEPHAFCVDGCSCPNATGYMEAPEESDEEKADEDQKYELKFWTEEGDINAYFTGGMVEIKQKEDGEEDVNEVMLEIKYAVTEKKDDDQAEEEQREMDCKVPYFISDGKVGGIEAKSAEPFPGKAPVADMQGNGKLTLHGSFPEDDCSKFEKGTPEHCWLQCAAAWEVETEKNMFTFATAAGNVDEDCVSHFGKGAQVGTGADYVTAQVTFDEDSFSMCTSTFDAELMTITTVDADYDNKFTIAWTTTEKKTCTSTYSVTSGAVLGIERPDEPAKKNGGGVAAGVIIGVIVCVAAIVVVVKRQRTAGSYQGIP
jgi:hypothetical protein